MLCLLERLRMDMGVPKDDSLNQLEFGYGSIEYSFYKGSDNLPKLPLPSVETPNVITEAEKDAQVPLLISTENSSSNNISNNSTSNNSDDQTDNG